MSDAYGIPGLGLSPVKDRTEQGSLDQETENEAEKSRRLQERHYFLLKELQKMAAEVPGKYQQRLPYEMLSDLANCLLNDTLELIVSGLRDIQHMTEKTIFEKRRKTLDSLKLKKISLCERLKNELALNLVTSEEIVSKEKAFDKEIEDQMHKFDMKAVMDLDQVMSEQQVTLEKTGVPGFHVTNNPNEVRLQMYILEFILRLNDTKHE